MMEGGTNTKSYKSAVWDAPIRVFHWLFAFSFSLAMLTQGDSRYLYIHVYAGYLLFGLLLFRMVWGVIGSYYARFGSFSYTLRNVLQYLKSLTFRRKQNYIGHNPAGSWSVFILLFTSFLISVSGFIVFAGEEGHGPLIGWISFEFGVIGHHIHEGLSWLMFLMVVVHLIGVLVSSVIHDDNLLIGMISGHKKTTQIAHKIKFKPSLGYLMVILTLVFSAYTFQGYFQATKTQPFIPYVGPELVQSHRWNQACGECHMPYHPSLLPAEIWVRLFSDPKNHFNKSLGYSIEKIQLLEEFAVNHSAEKRKTEAAKFIATTTPANFLSNRITDTPYWQDRHKSIPEKFWESKIVSRCELCHFDALKGTFEDSAMILPKLEPENEAMKNEGVVILMGQNIHPSIRVRDFSLKSLISRMYY